MDSPLKVLYMNLRYSIFNRLDFMNATEPNEVVCGPFDMMTVTRQ